MYNPKEFPLHAAIESEDNSFMREAVAIFVNQKISELEKQDHEGNTFLDLLNGRPKGVEDLLFALRMVMANHNLDVLKNVVDKTFLEKNGFAHNVKKWKNTFGVKSIKLMFDRKNSLSALLPLFFNASFVSNHLVRAAEKVEFDNENSPIIESKYERKIYEEGAKDIAIIPYRAVRFFGQGENKGHFFNLGGDHTALSVLQEELDAELSKIPEDLDVWTIGLGDKDSIGAFCKNEKEKKEFKHPKTSDSDKTYLLIPHDARGHAVLFVAVVDNCLVNNRKCVDSIIMINSLSDDHDYHISTMLDNSSKKIYGKVPVFIDASLLIQNKILKGVTDENCMIYRADYSLAFIKVLAENPDLKTRIENVTEETAKKLGEDIRKALKAHLTMYFDRDNDGKFKKKPASEVIDYFRKKRWDIGSQYINRGKLVERTKYR